MHIVTIVGARPQFIKAAVISRAIRDFNATRPPSLPSLREVIIHTGQHFDANMSQIFFDQMDIPRPDHNLGIGGTSHGAMTGAMLAAIEALLLQEKPDWVLVYGDTNSTLAGALAAAKLHLPLAHVEAGLRSFNRRMPEEINRVLTDHAAQLLLCPTPLAVENLHREGFHRIVNLDTLTGGAASAIGGAVADCTPSLSQDPPPLVCQVGDVMYDAALFYAPQADRYSTILEDLRLEPQNFVLATVHRQENTDDPVKLQAIFAGLQLVAQDLPVVLPLHPRTRKMLALDQAAAQASANLTILDPVGYLDMIRLEKNARVIITDSGGVQKEAYFYRVPCVTLRQETEWVELVDLGWNRLTPLDPQIIRQTVQEMDQLNSAPPPWQPVYGHGNAGKLSLDILQARQAIIGPVF